MKRIVLAALLIAAYWSAANAQTMVPKLDQEGRKGDVARLAKQKAQERFLAIDKDKDGRISKAEAEANSPYLAEHFPERDLNRDGFLSWEEFVGHNRWER
ncbi:MAG: hypothetical protein J0M07_22465 [Anaerolineae bacterium]|nr:hypothetical protein [Anaerolineae bacterium]